MQLLWTIIINNGWFWWMLHINWRRFLSNRTCKLFDSILFIWLECIVFQSKGRFLFFYWRVFLNFNGKFRGEDLQFLFECLYFFARIKILWLFAAHRLLTVFSIDWFASFRGQEGYRRRSVFWCWYNLLFQHFWCRLVSNGHHEARSNFLSFYYLGYWLHSCSALLLRM